LKDIEEWGTVKVFKPRKVIEESSQKSARTAEEVQ
jgi:hypothetical protein